MASISEDELADLPGPELVAHLYNTYRRVDFEAVARILVARDRRYAKLEAELAAALADLDAATARGREGTEVMAELEAAHTGIDALREKYRVLLDAFLPPRDEVEDKGLMVGAAAPDDAVRQDDFRVEEAEEGEVKDIAFIDLSSDDEAEERPAGGSEEEGEDADDTESLSQRIKRLRRVEPGELESGKVDVRGQNNSVRTLGNDLQKSSSLKIEVSLPVATTGKIVTKPEESKVVQESPVVKAENFGGELPKTMLLPSQQLLLRSSIQDGSSKSDYCKPGTADKGRSSGGVPARGVTQPSKGIEKMNKTPMVESSSAKRGNKEVGAQKCASLCIPSEEPRNTRDVVPFEPCNESNTYVQVKREMSSLSSAITSKWESEAHVFTSLFDEEVCMQAFCALYRQGKLPTADKRVEFRANKLAEFLLDGDLQGPMKRTVEELQKQDATNVLFIQKVTMDCSEKLYGIFRKREDPYFF